MSLPVVQMPPDLRRLLNIYKKSFTKPQFRHFKNIVAGQIISDKKNVQEINDCFSDCDQSSLNRFLTSSSWDEEAITKLRIKQIKENLKSKQGILIIDPTMIHKGGKHFEKANYHYSGLTKKKEWGHLLVDSLYISGEDSFPLRADMYLRKVDIDDKHSFKTIREICLDHVNYALHNDLPLDVVMLDGGLYADFLLREIKTKGLGYIVGSSRPTKISLSCNEERVNIDEYLCTIADLDFERFIIGDKIYYLHVKEVYKRRVGKEKLLISYQSGFENSIKIYTTNLLSYSSEELMSLLLKRWDIEVLHRDTKQHLGLEDYQVRKYDAIQKVVCVILVAYTLIALSKKHYVLKPLNRTIKTIGEGCRFFRLIAIKGWRWMKEKIKDISKLRDIMNRYVFVKNAKV